MKNLLLIPTLLWAALPAFAAAELISEIRGVTVYSDRAVVTRTARAELHQGINELSFPGLPANLLDESLQASGQGTASATILDISTREHFVATTPDARRAALEEQLTSLQEEQRSLSDRTALLKTQRELIERLQHSAVSISWGEKAERPNLDEVKETLAYGREETVQLNSTIQELDREWAKLEAQAKAVQHQLDELPPTAPRRSVKMALVRVQVTTPGDLDVELRYTSMAAGWQPNYDARVLTTDGRVQLGYYAQVWQGTGEDWEDVALSLSTARPALGGHAPKLEPWELDLRAEEPENVRPLMAERALPFRSKNFASDSAVAAVAAAPRLTFDLVEADYAEAQVERGASVASFQVATPASIRSDNSAKKIPITTIDLEAQLAYRATPKRLPTAFLDASVENTSDYPLLPGQMNVFVDHNFIASSRLSHTNPGEKFSLALGADEGLSITHKQVRKFTEQVGLMSKSTRTQYEYLIRVQNNKAAPVRLTVSDQVPVSRNDKISVKVQEPLARELKADAEGRLDWTLELAPGQARELPVKFTIEYPQGLAIDGL